MKKRETLEEARERISKRITRAQAQVWGCEDRLRELDALGIPRSSNGLIDVLLGFCGAKTEREKALDEYWLAVEEQEAARREWDSLEVPPLKIGLAIK